MAKPHRPLSKTEWDAISPTDIPDPLLTVEDAARALGVSDKTIRRYIHEKKILALVLADSNRLRIRQSELDRVLTAKP